MNDDELKQLWQQQPLREPAISAADTIAAAQKRMSQFRRSIAARDVGELVACAFVIIVFGLYAYFERTPIVRLGWLIVVGGTLFIAAKLIHCWRTNPPAAAGATIAESLRAELNIVRAQSHLLGAILWWYLLPPGIGLLLATWGMPIHLHAKIPATLLFVAIYGFIYWINQVARRKQLLPMEAQMESLLRSVETGAPLDETLVTELRPLVLSTAVKPVEFKVAFWQIALWSEVGFIGIWFFLMLGLTLDSPQAETKRPAVESPVVQLVETNRYSIVARNVIESLNDRDFASIQGRFSRSMNAFLPPREAAEFFDKLVERYGQIQSFASSTNGYGNWTAYRLICQRGDATMSLALNSNDQIEGIHFVRLSRPFQIQSLLQVFHWRRSVWIVPFFLAGLAFAWLLQKGTENAVGISPLGVHLNRGQTILLWDEIKEVRPLRVLNIRSLWLIKESGEKTVMPWTSLERRADLLAAVEESAPANHPIRQSLGLLKRE